MKKLILGLVLMLGAGPAHALHCSLNKENPKQKGTFDQALFESLEVLKDGSTKQLILVKPDGTIVENFDPKSVDTAEKWKALDKSIFAVLTRTQEKTLTIGTGSINLSNQEDILSMDTLAVGDEGKIFSVMNLAKKISLSCFDLQFIKNWHE